MFQPNHWSIVWYQMNICKSSLRHLNYLWNLVYVWFILVSLMLGRFLWMALEVINILVLIFHVILVVFSISTICHCCCSYQFHICRCLSGSLPWNLWRYFFDNHDGFIPSINILHSCKVYICHFCSILGPERLDLVSRWHRLLTFNEMSSYPTKGLDPPLHRGY